MDILERIFNFISQFWNSLNPFIIVKEYENGVILRLGKYRRTLLPGFHLKIPLVESSIIKRVTIVALCIGQSLITKDGVNAEIETMIKYTIVDIKKAILKIEDPFEVVDDVTKCQVKQVVANTNFKDINTKVDKDLVNLIHLEMQQYGVLVDSVKTTSIRQNDIEIFFKNIKQLKIQQLSKIVGALRRLK